MTGTIGTSFVSFMIRFWMKVKACDIETPGFCSRQWVTSNPSSINCSIR